jgi:hypothetical protein
VHKANIWTDEDTGKYFVDWLARNSEAVKYLNSNMEKMKRTEESLLKLLSQRFPEYKWGNKSSISYFKKSQYLVKTCLKAMFPSEGNLDLCYGKFTFYIVEVLEDYRHPDIKTSSNAPLEFDFFYPKYNIAFEYQV